MERLVLVHGSVVNGRATWSAQRPLADRFELVVLDRPGFPPNPPAARVDFESDARLVAELLRAGDHLVGSLLRWRHRDARRGPAARRARLADGDRASRDTRRERQPRRRRVRRRRGGAVRLGRDERSGGRSFDASSRPSARASILPPRSRPTSRRARRRSPSSAGRGRRRSRSTRWRRRRSRSSSSPGAHHPAFDAICDVLERELPAERAVLPGFGHVVQLHPEFNDAARRASSSERAEARRSGARWPRPARGPASARAGSRA